MAVGQVGSPKIVRLGASDGRVEYANGWIVFPREGSLMAQRFDPGALATRGDAMPIAENLTAGGAEGMFSVSPSGVLGVITGARHELGQLEWFDRNGRSLGVAAPAAEYRDIALSPDDGRIAMSLVDPARNKEDLWVRDIARGVTSRLTFDPGDEFNPVWSPDGERVAYSTDAYGDYRTVIRYASGAGAVDSLVQPASHISGPTGWSADGRHLLLRVRAPQTGWDLYQVDLTPGAKPVPFVQTPLADNWGRYSPDGRWVVYASNQSGRSEVYVQAADGSGGKWQVSNAGGGKPWWSANGKEIFYQSLDRTIEAVPVQVGATFETGTPLPLFRVTVAGGVYDGRRWAVSADGRRFLVNTPLAGPQRPAFTIVTNWKSELERK